MKIKNRNVYVFDNEGETIDRYTIVIGSTGELLGCNTEPFRGFGQHCGNLVDNRMAITYGVAWRKYCDVKKNIKGEVERYVNEARDTPSWLGKEIATPDLLPEQVIKFITQNL